MAAPRTTSPCATRTRIRRYERLKRDHPRAWPRQSKLVSEIFTSSVYHQLTSFNCIQHLSPWDLVPTRQTQAQGAWKKSTSPPRSAKKTQTGRVSSASQTCNRRRRTRSVLARTRWARNGPSARIILSSWMGRALGARARRAPSARLWPSALLQRICRRTMPLLLTASSSAEVRRCNTSVTRTRKLSRILLTVHCDSSS